MGRAGLLAAGVLLGGLAGTTAGLVLIYLWFEILGLPGLDNDPKGLSTAIIILLPSIAVGATAAPMWLVQRRARHASLRGPLLGLILIGAVPLLLVVGLTF